MSEYVQAENIHFIKVHLSNKDPWIGREIRELRFPHGMIVAVIQRKGKTLIPKGDLVMMEGDKVIMYTQMHVSHAQNIEI